MKKNVTIVTGIWDLGRENAGEGFKRPFSHYIERFKDLLSALHEHKVVVYIEEEHRDLVKSFCNPQNTVIRIKETDSFKTSFPFYQQVQDIRQNSEWYSQAEWLKNSTQATLELYNPLVMSKMFLLHDEKIMNPFNTDYFYWLDGGITSTVHPGYFYKDDVLSKLDDLVKKFMFITFPYLACSEIHGFKRDKMEELAGEKVELVCRGGFFGGHKKDISEINAKYYDLLHNTISHGYMGTEESLFTILTYKYPELFQLYKLTEDQSGIISYFFEDLKNGTANIEDLQPAEQNVVVESIPGNKVCGYVITFNSIKQLTAIYESWKDFGFETFYVFDNSNDESIIAQNIEFCQANNLERIVSDKGNIGICGGRQHVAEHFASTEHDYYIFIEDDMFLNKSDKTFCKNGFSAHIADLKTKLIKIMQKEKFDFLKLSFTEFFGDNKTQWAWYNVPQVVRERFWPGKIRLPEIGIDPNAPKTNFKNIDIMDGLPYITGEVYYCNWPQMVSKLGNEKMFLNTKWSHPYEQTWMSFMYQETMEGDLKPGLLLASPITHDRFDFYKGDLRREN
jgi:hypothetical protein